MKTCNKCLTSLSFCSFSPDKRNKDGHQGICRECRAKVVPTPEKLVEYRQTAYAKNKDSILATNKKWRQENPQYAAARRKTEAYKDYMTEYQKTYRSENRGKLNHLGRLYKEAKACRTPEWADKEAIEAMYILSQKITEITGVAMEVDHIIPLRGETISGLHVETNLQLLPASINRTKSNKIDKWKEGK